MTATDLTNALTRYQEARPALRQAMYESAIVIATRLANERDVLAERLDKRWDWCWTHTEHPAFIERETALLHDLTTYEAMQSALDHALDVLFPVAA